MFTAHAQKCLFTSFQSKIWPRHSLRRPRFPIRQMYLHHRVTFTGYIRCFWATKSHDLVTLTSCPWQCFMYSVFHVRPTFQFLLSYDYRLLSYDYWIFHHISVIWNSHYACAVSRDLCIVYTGSRPKPHVTIFNPELSINYTTFMGLQRRLRVVYIAASPC